MMGEMNEYGERKNETNHDLRFLIDIGKGACEVLGEMPRVMRDYFGNVWGNYRFRKELYDDNLIVWKENRET